MFMIHYYPEDIAQALINLTDEDKTTDAEKFNEIEEAIYHLKCVCENQFNDRKFRTLYRILEDLTRRENQGDVKNILIED